MRQNTVLNKVDEAGIKKLIPTCNVSGGTYEDQKFHRAADVWRGEEFPLFKFFNPLEFEIILKQEIVEQCPE